MGEEIKRWTARSKSALVLEIIQGKTAVAAASSSAWHVARCTTLQPGRPPRCSRSWLSQSMR
ncbi:hypothetical protein [Xanthomonas hortorum]|uniref:hypothetical protein n=1 Tax=Xanthomonas hortorum TaxID=56454 RepID=UPI0035B559D1